MCSAVFAKNVGHVGHDRRKHLQSDVRLINIGHICPKYLVLTSNWEIKSLFKQFLSDSLILVRLFLPAPPFWFDRKSREMTLALRDFVLSVPSNAKLKMWRFVKRYKLDESGEKTGRYLFNISNMIVPYCVYNSILNLEGWEHKFL